MPRHKVDRVNIGDKVLETGQVWTPMGRPHGNGSGYHRMRIIGFTPRQVVVEVVGWSRGKRHKLWSTPFNKFVTTNTLVK